MQKKAVLFDLDGTLVNSIPDISESYYNHSIVFAAEKSREENSVVDFAEYFSQLS